MSQSRNTLKGWFSTGLKPLQSHFHAWLDSYFHISDMIPQSNVQGLTTALNNLPTSEQVNALNQQVLGITVTIANAGTISLGAGKLLDVAVISGANQAFSIGTTPGGSEILADVIEDEPYVLRLGYYTAAGTTLHITCTNLTIKYWSK